MSDLVKAICISADSTSFNPETAEGLHPWEPTHFVQACRTAGIYHFFIAPDNLENPDYSAFTHPDILAATPPFDRQHVDTLEGYQVLLQAHYTIPEPALEGIAQLGGVNAVTAQDLRATENWLDVVNPQYLGRRMAVFPCFEMRDHLGEYAVDGKVFIKTKKKLVNGNGMLFDVEMLYFALGMQMVPYLTTPSSHHMVGVELDTDLIISEPVVFDSDDQWSIEYRAWIVDHKIAVMRRYGIESESRYVPSRFAEAFSRFVAEHARVLPGFYTVDMGLLNGSPVVIELNPITNAGYLNQELFGEVIGAYVR